MRLRLVNVMITMKVRNEIITIVWLRIMLECR
jgi:hypothetical protein